MAGSASHPGVQTKEWALFDANKSGTADAFSLRLLNYRGRGLFSFPETDGKSR